MHLCNIQGMNSNSYHQGEYVNLVTTPEGLVKDAVITGNQYDSSLEYEDYSFISTVIFNTRLYDKRDAFRFSAVRMPYKCSNMPYKMFYSTINAEVLRIFRATCNYTFFLDSVKKLIS